MRLGRKYYRRLQHDLDQLGIATCIIRIGEKRYQWIINYEVIAERKTRQACNRHLIKLHSEKTKATDHVD